VAVVERPDGAQVYYEVEGSGFPLLLLAPGGVSSEARFFRESSVLNAFELVDEFMVIGMNQRHTTGSPGDLVAPSWSSYADDQRAVLDALGIDRALLWGGCIGVGYCLRLIVETPERVVAAVCQDPVGLVEGVNDRSTFWAMFEPTVNLAEREGMAAVVGTAMSDPMFVRNNAAGPWAPRISSDPSFRQRVLELDVDEYMALVRAWDEHMWGAEGLYMSVPEVAVSGISTPILVLPGGDVFHPTEISMRLCAEAPGASCLDVDCRSEAKRSATMAAVRRFLRDRAS